MYSGGDNVHKGLHGFEVSTGYYFRLGSYSKLIFCGETCNNVKWTVLSEQVGRLAGVGMVSARFDDIQVLLEEILL